jgi:hypothetical protein
MGAAASRVHWNLCEFQGPVGSIAELCKAGLGGRERVVVQSADASVAIAA